MDIAPFDQKKASEVLSSISLGLLDTWRKYHSWGNGSPYARIETFSLTEDTQIHIHGVDAPPSSNHKALEYSRLLMETRQRIRQLQEMVFATAPVLNHRSNFWDIEFSCPPKYTPHSGKSDDDPCPLITFYISGIHLRSPQNEARQHAEDVAQHLGFICQALSPIRCAGERLFCVNEAHIRAGAPEEACLIYDALTQSNLLNNIDALSPKISEILDPLTVHSNMRRRFGTQTDT